MVAIGIDSSDATSSLPIVINEISRNENLSVVVNVQCLDVGTDYY